MTAQRDTPAQLHVSTLLARLALAMQNLHHMVCDVETTILDGVHANGPQAAVPVSIQQLDHVLQTIDELAQLIHRLSEQQLHENQLLIADVIAPVRLERLRNLLEHEQTGKEENMARQHNAGDVSLF